MTTTSPTSLACPTCGAPALQAASPGQLHCTYCGSVFSVPAAPSLPPTQISGPTTQVVYVAPQPSGKARASLVLGIVGLTLIPVVASVLALVLGLIARREIAASGGRLTGAGAALAGMLLGGLGLIGCSVLLLLNTFAALSGVSS